MVTIAPTDAYSSAEDAGMDVYAVEGYSLQPGETAAIPIGLAFQLPTGFEFQIRSRTRVCNEVR